MAETETARAPLLLLLRRARRKGYAVFPQHKEVPVQRNFDGVRTRLVGYKSLHLLDL